MVELIIIACLMGAPDDCHEHRLRMSMEGMDAAQCVYASPPLVARWAQSHPKWLLKSWRCAFVGRPRRA